MIILLIYFSGFFTTLICFLIMLKKDRKRTREDASIYVEDLLPGLMLSIMSWIIAIPLLLIVIGEIYKKEIHKFLGTKLF